MKNKIIFYTISLIVSLLFYPITKFVLDKKACDKNLIMYKEQEEITTQTLTTNKQEINVIKKKLVSNSGNRAYREQLLSQIPDDEL